MKAIYDLEQYANQKYDQIEESFEIDIKKYDNLSRLIRNFKKFAKEFPNYPKI